MFSIDSLSSCDRCYRALLGRWALQEHGLLVRVQSSIPDPPWLRVGGRGAGGGHDTSRQAVPGPPVTHSCARRGGRPFFAPGAWCGLRAGERNGARPFSARAASASCCSRAGRPTDQSLRKLPCRSGGLVPLRAALSLVT